MGKTMIIKDLKDIIDLLKDEVVVELKCSEPVIESNVFWSPDKLIGVAPGDYPDTVYLSSTINEPCNNPYKIDTTIDGWIESVKICLSEYKAYANIIPSLKNIFKITNLREFKDSVYFVTYNTEWVVDNVGSIGVDKYNAKLTEIKVYHAKVIKCLESDDTGVLELINHAFEKIIDTVTKLYEEDMILCKK